MPNLNISPGDRLRVVTPDAVIEGVVTAADQDNLSFGDTTVPVTAGSVERLSAPLPTTPGSLVVVDGSGYFLTVRGWVSPSDTIVTPGFLQSHGATVLWDASLPPA